MRIAFLVPDNREIERNYSPDTPYFGTAPTGLLEGFAELGQAGGGGTARESGMRQGDSREVSGEPVEVHVISCTQRPMRSPEKLADNIFFHSLHVPKWGWLKSGYAGCILAIRRKVRELQPDIIHAQGTERECAISAAFCPHPRVLTIHGNLRLIKKVLKPRPWSALALQSLVEGFSVPRFDGVVCITNYTRAAVEKETPRTWVIPNAVDPAFLDLGQERRHLIHHSPSKTQNSILLVVANVDARKNQNAFIRALDPLADALPFRVKFFGKNGGGDYGAEFDRLVAARPWCEFGGMISRDALREEFRQAALVALPTHEDNCPMVVLEAQAAGLPVMASDVGGVPDLIEDGRTGLLTNPADPETMRTAVRRLLTDPALVESLVRNGRVQALEKFHPRVIAGRHVEIYRQLVGR